MKIFLKFTPLLILLTIFVVSCSKETEREGCTDSTALNFNSLAVTDDGSCEYLDSSVNIWSDGEAGFWGDIITGEFEVKSCLTDTNTIFLNPDTTFVPADTIITANPPDTTYIPADTLIDGDTYLLVHSDSLGNYKLLIQLINKKNAADFKNGFLIFNAKLHPDNDIDNFELFIHGNHLSSGGPNCDPYYYSDPIVISSASLDTSSFTEITMPLIDFANRHMQEIDLVFGLQGTNASPNTSLIMIENIKWVASKEEE